jgi:predicted amidophosphoribosyltransferase
MPPLGRAEGTIVKTALTIRNCAGVFKKVCPQRWDQLTPTSADDVRHCGTCSRDVHWCRTDEETLAHARAGHCIAREIPDGSELPAIVLGEPAEPMRPTPSQELASEWTRRERGVDDAIVNIAAARVCPACGYPAPRWRTACRVCEGKLERLTDDREIEPPNASSVGESASD